MSYDSTIDARYFDWLYSQIANLKERSPRRSHILLCERLYKTPFEWYIHNDDNRSEDGRLLREEFLDMHHERYDRMWLDLDTSLFEMMIALARRASFQTGMGPDVWFWKMLENIELAKYTDEVYHNAIDEAVQRSISRVMRREYHSSGRGGFFPLRAPEGDQREVELWYQLSAYLLENIEF